MVVSNRYDPDVRVQKEAACLVEAGHSVTVYAFDREHNCAPLDEILDGVSIERIRVRKSRIGNMVETVLGLNQFRAEVKHRLLSNPPHVVHCHDQDTCSIGLWWKKKGARKSGHSKRGKYVFDAHDLYWTWLLLPNPKSKLRRVGAVALRGLDAYYAHQADLLITTSEAIGPHPGFAEIYKAIGLNPLVIWNAPQKVPEPPLYPKEFTIGYIGSVREVSMFEWLIEAIEKLPQKDRPMVRVAGGGRCQSEVEQLFNDAASRLHFNAKVTGVFNFATLNEIIGETSIQYCLYPTERGNMDRAMAVKLLDSVAHGRPVIGNAGTLMGDWIEANNWGWTVEEGNSSALAETISTAREHLNRNFASINLSPPPEWDDEKTKLVHAYASRLQIP